MAFLDRVSFEDLRNVAETLVFQEMERQLSTHPRGDEFTEDAIVDIAACSLNLVKPMYRANLLGRIYETALSAEHQAEIETAVRESIARIESNPPE